MAFIIVKSLFSADILWGLAQGDTHFRMRIFLGAVLIRSLVFFLSLKSGMSPERVRNEAGLVGSEEIYLVLIRRPKCDSMSYWTPETVSLSLYSSAFSFLWHLSNITFLNSREFAFRASLFLGRSSWLLLLMAANFLLFLRVAIFEEGKNNRECFKTESFFVVL